MHEIPVLSCKIFAKLERLSVVVVVVVGKMKKISFLTIRPKHPLGFPMVPNRQPNVPWEVKMKYFTMAWFQYGKTGCYTFERWTKEYLIILDMFWRFFESESGCKNATFYFSLRKKKTTFHICKKNLISLRTKLWGWTLGVRTTYGFEKEGGGGLKFWFCPISLCRY